jgi:diguanylate cyclase (GGDEF)-like protein
MVKTINPSTDSERVLIIDDDLVIKEILEDILDDHGYHTAHAANGMDGLRLLDKYRPETILLDIEMPGMNGIEVCQSIRKRPLKRRPSIIVLSSNSNYNIVAEVFNKGADDFIIKPVNPKELIARIQAQSRIRSFHLELEKRNNELELILDITESVSRSLDYREILYSIVKKTADITEANRCSIVLVDKGDDAYVMASHESPTIRDLRIDLKKYPEIKEVLNRKERLIIEDMATHPIFKKVKNLIRNLAQNSLLIMPIVWKEEILGTLILRTRRSKKSFTSAEINLCQIIANAAYHPLKKAKLFENLTEEKDHLKKLAITDQLTALYNHDFFYNRLEDEFNRAVRYGLPISLLMIDLDNFKKINDTYGHRAGDRVLMEVAGLLKKAVRKTDIIARYGGEEFTVILPVTKIEGAEEEAERIRESLCSHSYAGLINTPISASIGVASFPCEGVLNSGDLVNLADNALYKAKNSGRNKVAALCELSATQTR